MAWLHEVIERTAVAEQELLANGLTSEELRALSLLHRAHDSRSDRAYLAHVYPIARAAGSSGHLARLVKIADLEDRRRHPRVRADGAPEAGARTNLLERSLAEVKRRTKVIGRFPGETSCLTLRPGRP